MGIGRAASGCGRSERHHGVAVRREGVVTIVGRAGEGALLEVAQIALCAGGTQSIPASPVHECDTQVFGVSSSDILVQ
jgi:hypothetical protein